jgi:hypothetical protein
MYGYNLGLAKARVSESVPAAPANVVLPSLVGNGAVGTIVTCNPGAWSGSPSPTFTFNFKLDTVSVQSGASNTYTPLIGDDTKTLTCTVTATNTEGTASVDSSNSFVVGTIPVNTVAPVISGTNTFGSTLTTTNGTFTGTAPLTYTYQWLRGGSPISGQTANTYVIGSSDSLANITCSVTGTNSYGSDSEVSNTITVANFAPVNTVAPTVSPSGTQSTGTLITANDGTWSGVAPITFEYKWTRNGVAISGATASTYTIQLADDGTTIRVEVKGTNAYGVSAFIASSNSVSAVNVIAPTNTVAPVISGTTVVSQVLTTTNGTWANSPTSFSYQWKRGATNVGTNATTYTLVSADAGQSITCVVTATNAGGSANATSNALSIFDTIMDSQTDVYNAWSMVRLLRGAYYNSPIIRLRRTNDNVESNFGVGTNGLLDESAITTWTGANSATLVTLYAQDGSTRHFTNATPSEQPTFVNAGVIVKRTGIGSGAVARPAADFNGTQSLSVTSSQSLYNFIHNGNFGYIAAVAEFSKVADPNALYGLLGNYALNGSNIGFSFAYEDRTAAAANNALRMNAANGLGATVVLSLNSNTITPQQVNILTSQFDCDNATANNRNISYINNGSALTGNIQTAAPSVSNASFNLQLGSAGNNTFRLIGYTSEIIIFNADKSAANTSIITNINAIYKTY